MTDRMEVIRPSDGVAECRPCVATIGFFDGVHKGHQFLIRQVQRWGAELHLPSAVITFSQSPRQVVHPGFRSGLLTTLDEKLDLLSATGVDECLLLDFTREMALLSAREFMASVLRDRYHVRALVIGYDHRFGHNRLEGFEDYRAYGKELGIEVIQASQYLYKGEKVSSTIIRNLLERGNIKEANELAGHPFTLTGTVVKGFQVGRTLNFPTANMQRGDGDNEKLLPGNGVYAVRVLLDGKRYGGMLNIGTRPTVNNGTNRTIETHIFHFSGDIYGHRFSVAFIDRLRAEQKFHSLRDLQDQLEKDKMVCEQILSGADAVAEDNEAFRPHIEQ